MNATTVLNDSPNSVSSTTAGTTYSASAWVRTKRPSATVQLRLLEWKGSTVGYHKSSVSLTDTAWHHVTVSYVAKDSGATLDLNVLVWQLAAGHNFDVDDVRLTATAPTLTSSTTTTTSSAGAPSGYSLKWHDEFNGTSVDTGKWRVRNGDYLGYDLECIWARNVSEGNGYLTIEARHQSTTCGSRSSSYTSGYLDTIGKASWTYGYMVMRAKLPTQANTSKGMWPAFWLRPTDGGIGELDIMEAIGSGGTSTEWERTHHTIWYDYNGTYADQSYDYKLPNSESTAAWHTYAVLWAPGSIKWYVDGKVVYTRNTSTTSWLDKAFSRPFDIRLNLQVGGSWPGSPNSSTDFPADYRIDYVRVYQK